VWIAAMISLLTVASGGFYWTTGRLPGRRPIGSLADRIRAARHALSVRRRHQDSDADPPDAASADPSDADEAVPPSLLPNEQRVLRLLDEHDRQIRQSDIVEETSWSKAKVSRVLSQMEADDEIIKIDIGRENVVLHPEDVPSGAKVESEP
jgi:DNA-binding MarR family transcriptional regulator